jgi:hypothetical protein
MMTHSELEVQYAYERRRDHLAAAERDRRAAACEGWLPLSRLAARPLGRALLGAGAWLLRYGKAESAPTRAYRPSAGSVKLN